MERRNFLKTMFGVAAGMAFPDILSASAAPLASSRSTSDRANATLGTASPIGPVQANDPLALATYQPLLNSEFQLQAGTCVIPVQLVEVDELEAVGHMTQQENFALLFRGPQGAPLVQETYTMSHPAMGTFQMFLVPVGAPDGAHYQAIIHR